MYSPLHLAQQRKVQAGKEALYVTAVVHGAEAII
jgi:hypothetical protein